MTIRTDEGETNAASRRLDVMARIVDLDVPAACREGVIANLVLLDSHAARLAGFIQDEAVTPAPKFRP
jgi:hypothetical protein